MIDLPETDDPVIDGLAFMAEATVIVGASFLAGFGIAELLRRKEQKECER